ncbi:hypothetical protein QTP88_012354 [Uroleucon formosanum]
MASHLALRHTREIISEIITFNVTPSVKSCNTCYKSFEDIRWLDEHLCSNFNKKSLSNKIDCCVIKLICLVINTMRHNISDEYNFIQSLSKHINRSIYNIYFASTRAPRFFLLPELYYFIAITSETL